MNEINVTLTAEEIRNIQDAFFLAGMSLDPQKEDRFKSLYIKLENLLTGK